MKPKPVVLALSALLLAALTLVPLPSSGFPGFDDDTSEPCLGINDPFCGSVGGSSGGHCYDCVTTISSQTMTLKCETGTRGSSCRISTVDSDTLCATSGSC